MIPKPYILDLKRRILIVIILLIYFISSIPISAQTDQITSLSWGHQGNYIAVGYNSGEIEIRNLTLNISILVGQISIPILNLSWNPELPNQLIPTTDGYFVSVFNTELTGNAQLISTAIYGAPFIYGTDLVNDYGAGVGDTSDIEWSPNGTQIASAHN